MKPFILILFSCLFICLLLQPGFSQVTHSTKKTSNTDSSKTAGLTKMAGGVKPENLDFDLTIDEDALEKSLETMELALESVEQILEQIEISMEPIEMNFDELEVNIDPIVIDIPDFDMAMEPIEMDDLAIDLDEIRIDRSIHDRDHEKTFHQEGEKKSGSSEHDSKGKSKGLKKIN